MDDAIYALLKKGAVTPNEAFMKAIDKSRFKQFLPLEEKKSGDSAGA
jgi:twitching motility protein PilT